MPPESTRPTSSTRPPRPRPRPSTPRRDSLRPKQMRSRIAIHSGSMATSRAATPDAIRCSAQTTPPLPPTSRAAPTIAAARHCAGPSGSSARPPRHVETAKSTAPATRKRVAAMRNGGNVSMAMRIARYVEPQTMYTVPSAAQMRVGVSVCVACVASRAADMRRHLERERVSRRKRTLHSNRFSLGYAGSGAPTPGASASGARRTHDG